MADDTTPPELPPPSPWGPPSPSRSPWDPPAGHPPSPPPTFVPSGPSPSDVPPGPPQPGGEWAAVPPAGIQPAGIPPAGIPPAGIQPPAPQPSPPPFPGGAGAVRGGPVSEPVRGVRGQRYGGPRFGGRGLLAVFGLLGLLLTVGIMVFLAVQVLDGVSGGSRSDDAETSKALEELVPSTAPAATQPGATPSTAGADGSAQVSPGGPMDAALDARCAADRQTVALAASAYETMNGSYPPDVETLVDAGLVHSDHPLEVEMHVSGTAMSVVGTGSCAGR